MEGTISSSAVVSIGKTGKFKGDIKAVDVVVNGVANGKIEAASLEILSGGRVIGEVFVENITIQNMGIFNGICHQKEEKLQEPQKIELKK
ncbi:hypothetical protein NitYY0826_C0192 [Nitratiruptor sp. YY08-26]|nr:hypothetical protein NitYY0813_C0192 [Nitratiruptor sp. YY08-13]BCD65286.1 hypothetical protein NitYY0826_C0192 [Nitratiruptor sp. YY08-26]